MVLGLRGHLLARFGNRIPNPVRVTREAGRTSLR